MDEKPLANAITSATRTLSRFSIIYRCLSIGKRRPVVVMEAIIIVGPKIRKIQRTPKAIDRTRGPQMKEDQSRKSIVSWLENKNVRA